MARVSMAKWYDRVSDAWPDELPELTGEEAVRAAAKLFRFVHGRRYTKPIRVGTGNTLSGFDSHGIVVNPRRYRYGNAENPVEDYGWEDMIHGLSHDFGRTRAERQHGGAHARLEIRMIKEVIKRGWLNGTLKAPERAPKPEPTKDELRAKKLVALEAKLKRWTTKLKRAQTAMRQLHRSRSAMLRHAAAANDGQAQLAA